MAARFFVNGGVNNNWSDTSNWSATSGGAGGQSIPILTDTVTLDNNSPNCINDDSERRCVSLDCSLYTNTLTINHGINVTNLITLGVNMKPIQGMGYLGMRSNGTLTSNGITIPNLALGTSTLTLADDAFVRGMVYAPNAFISGVGRTITIAGYVEADTATFGGTATKVFIIPSKTYVNDGFSFGSFSNKGATKGHTF